MVGPRRTLARGGLGLLVAGLWFGWGGPWAVGHMDRMRAETSGQPGIGKLVAAAATERASLLPRGADARQAAVWLEGALAADLVDRTWTARAFALLDEDQRQVRTSLQPAPRMAHRPWLDPEVSALLGALGSAHGWAEAESPPPGMPDLHGEIPRQTRSLMLLELAHQLRPEQAHALQALALEVAQAQQERFQAEAGLSDMLDDEILAAARQGAYDLGLTEDLLTVLGERSQVE